MPRRRPERPEATTLRRGQRLVPDIRAILAELHKFLNQSDGTRKVLSARCGVYAFFDYDDEPIYVGQTREGLRTRIRRHLTNQRTDAVAMKILDPMEVARVEVWPFWELEDKPEREQTRVLRAAEFTVFEDLTRRAKVGRLLNEKIPASAERVRMPASYSASIIPDEIRERLGHSDERIARRAATIAALAQVVRERDVSLGLRETLVAQAERLRYLASRRLEEVRGDTPNPKTETRLNPGED